MGRPAKTPTDEQRAQVREWVKARVSIEEMARRLSLTSKTFRKHYAEEIGAVPVETVITQPVARFVATVEQRQSVLILAGARISHDEIARKIGVSTDVLREHFADELRRGPGQCKADVLESMFYAGKSGNVAAAKVYLTFNAMSDEPTPAQPAAQGLQGKKQTALVASQTAERGTPWEGLVTPGSKPN